MKKVNKKITNQNSKHKKLPIKDRIFFQNFFSFILIFLAVTFMLGYATGEDGETANGFLEGYIITSVLCVLYLGAKTGLEFQNSHEITEKRCNFLDKEKITIQEFRKKYKDVIAIYDKSDRVFDDIEKEEIELSNEEEDL